MMLNFELYETKNNMRKLNRNSKMNGAIATEVL